MSARARLWPACYNHASYLMWWIAWRHCTPILWTAGQCWRRLVSLVTSKRASPASRWFCSTTMNISRDLSIVCRLSFGSHMLLHLLELIVPVYGCWVTRFDRRQVCSPAMAQALLIAWLEPFKRRWAVSPLWYNFYSIGTVAAMSPRRSTSRSVSRYLPHRLVRSTFHGTLARCVWPHLATSLRP